MTQATHTPGPYLYDGRDIWAPHGAGNDKASNVAAKVKPCDAPLLTAAPDMLAALEDIISSSNANCQSSLANAIQAAIPIVAKARGEG